MYEKTGGCPHRRTPRGGTRHRSWTVLERSSAPLCGRIRKVTRQLLATYGDQLVCIRYRYDRTRGKRYKTVELIVEERDWIPGVTIPVDPRVLVTIGYGETELREHVKAASGFWSAVKKAWVLYYRKAVKLGLEKRIVDEELGL